MSCAPLWRNALRASLRDLRAKRGHDLRAKIGQITFAEPTKSLPFPLEAELLDWNDITENSSPSTFLLSWNVRPPTADHEQTSQVIKPTFISRF